MRASIPVVKVFNIASAALLAAVLCGTSASISASGWQAMRDAAPDANHSPEEVVRLQMSALGLNRELGNDEGIAVAFRFASPANKRFTGPLERFVGLLNNPAYRPMLEYASVEFGESRRQGDEVGVLVKLSMSSGEAVGYVFVLSQQSGDPCSCWMTDRVIPVDLGDQPEPGKNGKSV